MQLAILGYVARSAPSADKKAKSSFGRYTVIERLGSGAMATVDRAILRGRGGFERSVALKRIHPTLFRDPELRAAFIREAKLVSRLKHGHIAQLNELGEEDGVLYIAMEYVPGDTLFSCLQKVSAQGKDIPVDVVISILYDVLDALDYAHTLTDGDGYPLGLMHRDICPQNLVLTPYGAVKLIDFGVASELFCSPTEIRGKVAYLPPEAKMGHADPRGDLFALGVVGYQLLTGDTAGTPPASDEEFDRAFGDDVPKEFVAWLKKSIQGESTKRFQSARAMRGALVLAAEAAEMYPDHRKVENWYHRGFARRAVGTDAPMSEGTDACSPTPSPGALRPDWQFDGVRPMNKKNSWEGQAVLASFPTWDGNVPMVRNTEEQVGPVFHGTGKAKIAFHPTKKPSEIEAVLPSQDPEDFLWVVPATICVAIMAAIIVVLLLCI